MKNSSLIALFLIYVICSSFLISESYQFKKSKDSKGDFNSTKELEDLMNNEATPSKLSKIKNLKANVKTVGVAKDGKDCVCKEKEKNDCFKSRNCGWCFQNERCISGTKYGPINPCKATSFYYDNPKGNWNPQEAATINIFTGKDKLILTQTPDLSNVFVDSQGGFRKKN